MMTKFFHELNAASGIHTKHVNRTINVPVNLKVVAKNIASHYHVMLNSIHSEPVHSKILGQ